MAKCARENVGPTALLSKPRRRLTLPGPSEDALQIQTIQLLRLKLDPGVLVHHSPNGGKRSAREAARFRAMGTRAGFPDLWICWQTGAGPSDGVPVQAFIEMKSAKGTLTEAQIAFFRQLDDLGIPHAVCRSSAEVLERLEAWGVPMRRLR